MDFFPNFRLFSKGFHFMKKNNTEKKKKKKSKAGSAYSLLLKNEEGKNLHTSWIEMKNPLRKLRFQGP